MRNNFLPRLPALMTRFDEVRDTGLLLPTAIAATGTVEGEFLFYFLLED